MKKLIFIICLLLTGCEQENVLPSNIENNCFTLTCEEMTFISRLLDLRDKPTAKNILEELIEAERDGEIGVGALPNYSTGEVATGQTWINGKPVYQRLIQWTGAANGLIYDGSGQPAFAEAETIFDIHCFVSQPTINGTALIDANEEPQIIDDITSVNVNGAIFVIADVDDTGFVYRALDKTTRLNVNVDLSVFSGIIICRYTKTTD